MWTGLEQRGSVRPEAFELNDGCADVSPEAFEPIEADRFARPIEAGWTVRGRWSGRSTLFDELQYFVCLQDGGEWFIELTFFPESLHLNGTVAPLTSWLREALSVAKGTGAIVRTENASFNPTWERRDHREVMLSVGPE